MDHDLLPWKPEPDFRGTWSIFTSCLSTFIVCIWSALHVDIQKGRSTKTGYLSKAGWLLVALLCPELLLLTAFNQFREAVCLTRDGQRMLFPDNAGQQPSRKMRVLYWLIGDEGTRFELHRRDNQAVVRKHPWTLTHGFYAAMGGFVLSDPYVGRSDDHYLPAWQMHGVLTPEGIRLLMRYEPSLIPDLAADDILDRSKADGLTKALLVWQVLWFLLTCLNRLVQGLPLCLLEVSTIAHALCSLLTYALWWYKPKDINHPTAIVSPNSRPIGAWMSMGSLADRYMIAGILKIEYLGEMAHIKLDTTGNGAHARQVSSRFLRRETSAQGVLSFRVMHVEHSISIPGIGGAGFSLDRQLYHRRDRDNLNVENRRGPWSLGVQLRDHLRDTVYSWRPRLIFGATNLPWYVDSFPETPEEKQATELRWLLASEAIQLYNLSQPDSPTLLVRPVASLQRFSRSRHDSSSFTMSRVALVIPVVGAIYGLPHLIGLTAIFASPTERTLWIVAIVLITVLFAALGVVLSGITTVYLNVVLFWSNRPQAEIFKTQDTLLFLGRSVTVLGAFVYFVSSAYLVAESVRQLFALPAASFTLPSWGNYWPHFS